jgi:hypothetical protein
MAITQTKRPNRELSQSATGTKRPARKSFDRQGPLSVQGGPPDKVLRIVNDVRNRVHQLLSIGYVFVSKDSVVTETDELTTSTEMGSAKSYIVGYDDRSNKPIMAYLMAIDKDLYDENQAYKQEDQDSLIGALGETQKHSVPGSYVPK